MASTSVLKRALQIWQWLSLDVVLGALASGGMVAHLLQVRMPGIWWVALPLSVWVIYTTDHLLDAHRLGMHARTERHRFHVRWFHPLLWIWGLALLSCVTWVAWMVPRPMLWLGLAGGGLVLVHLGLVWLIGNRVSWMFQKELGVGLIYSVGVWGGPVVLVEGGWNPAWTVAALQFLGLAWFNLVTFAWYDRHADAAAGQSSWVQALGRGGTRMVWLLLAVGILVSSYWVWDQGRADLRAVQMTYWAMLLVLAIVVLAEPWLAKDDWYRFWADVVFIFPAWIWV